MTTAEPKQIGVLAEEYRIWNTPALGAFLFWIFAHAYVKTKDTHESPSVINFFILSGILDDKHLLSYVTASLKLRSMVSNINHDKNSDMIDALHDRVKARMEYTSDAIDIAVGCGLLSWDADTARLTPNSVHTPAGFAQYRESAYIHRLELAVKRLGNWFGDITDISQLVTLLKIRL